MRPIRIGSVVQDPSRRAALGTLSSYAVLVGTGALGGCGGGSSGDGAGTGGTPTASTPAGSPVATPVAVNPPNPVAPSPLPGQTRLVSGSIAVQEVGGANLRVHSAYWRNNPAAGSSFSTVTSTQGSQLLMLADHTDPAKGVLRGLSVALPGSAALEFSAMSTALATIMMTLGVLTVDATETAQRIALIQSLPSFAPFVAVLRQKLPGSDLISLGKDAQFIALRAAVTADVLAALQPEGQRTVLSEGRAHALGTFASGGMDAAYTAPATATGAAGVALSNPELRFVSVARTKLDAAGKVIGTTVFPLLKGAQVPGHVTSQTNLVGGKNAASWGNLLTGQLNGPGTASDDLTASDAGATVRYTFVGPGIPGGASLPADVGIGQFGLKAATVATVFFYILGPLLDFVGGASTALKQLGNGGLKTGQEIATGLGGLAVNIGGLDAALASGDLKSTIGACIDLSLAIVGTGSALAVVLGLAADTGPVAVALGVIGELSALMAYSNINLAVASLLTHPLVGSTDVAVPAKGSRYTPTLLPIDGVQYQSVKSINRNGAILYWVPNNVTGNAEVRIVKAGADRLVLSLAMNQVTDTTLVLTNLNDAEHFAYAVVPENGPSRAFLYRDGVSVDLGVNPALINVPLALNSNDEVVVVAAPVPVNRFIVRSFTPMVSRDTPTGRKATVLSADLPQMHGISKCFINQSGQVALEGQTGDPDLHINEQRWTWLIDNGRASVITVMHFNDNVPTIGDQIDKHLLDFNDAGVMLFQAQDNRVDPAIAEGLTWQAGVFKPIASYHYTTQFGSYTGSGGGAITDKGQVLGYFIYNADNSSTQLLEDLINYTPDVPKGYPVPIISDRASMDFVIASKTGQIIVTIDYFPAGSPQPKKILALLTPT